MKLVSPKVGALETGVSFAVTELLPGASPHRVLSQDQVILLSHKTRFAKRIGLGGVAQLVERLLCKQDVIGSNPFASTKFSRSSCMAAHRGA